METGAEISVEQALDMVSTGFDVLAEHGASFHDPAGLTNLLMTPTGLRSRLDPVIATTAVEVDRWSVQKDASYRTVAQLFGDKTSDNPKQTRTDARIRRWIDDFPKFTQAWTAGDITTSHLEHIRRSVHNSRTRAALITDQAKFITWATDFDFIDFIDFEHICIYWKNAVDPDSAEPKEQTTKNYFRAQEQGDSSGKLDGHLDPLMFAAYKTAFNREDEKLFHQNHDNAVFNNAVFNNAVFNNAVFNNAVFNNAVFNNAVFNNAVFNNAVFNNAVFNNAVFNNAVFNNAVFNNAVFNNAVFNNAVFNNAVFNNAVFNNAVFNNAVFNNAVFNNAVFNNAVFNNAVFNNAVFNNAVFNNAVFNNAVFNNAVFNNAVFGDAVFGDAEHVPDLTTGQRGAHALMNLVVKGAARPDGSQPEPLITPNPSSLWSPANTSSKTPAPAATHHSPGSKPTTPTPTAAADPPAYTTAK